MRRITVLSPFQRIQRRRMLFGDLFEPSLDFKVRDLKEVVGTKANFDASFGSLGTKRRRKFWQIPFVLGGKER